VLSLELGQAVQAAINTVHIHLEHSISWRMYLSLLEFCWQRDKTYFIAASTSCVMCNILPFIHITAIFVLQYFNSKSTRCLLVWKHKELTAYAYPKHGF
jgi:hypothetical protein